MGYDTKFMGELTLSRPLTMEENKWLMDFSERDHPECAPSKFCQWIPSDDGTTLVACGEKFYKFKEWLQVLIRQFFKPRGILLAGDVFWRGDDEFDIGLIRVTGHKIEATDLKKQEIKDILISKLKEMPDK